MGKNSRVATVILAGGEGTRLYPLTAHHSKSAIAYGGKYRLIDIPISNALNADFRHIFIIAQYLSAELQHHINQTYHFDAYNSGSIDVLTPQMNEAGEHLWFYGTADAVRKTLPALLKSPADYFLILSGDQLYNLDLQQMLHFAKKTRADLTIACLPVIESQAKRMGLLKINAAARVTQFIEKPKTKQALHPFRSPKQFFKSHPLPTPKEPSYLGSMGIYIFKRKALISLLAKDPREDFGYHLIHTALRMGKTSAFLHFGYWEDIGTISSYYKANLSLAQSDSGLNLYDESHPIYTHPTVLPGPKIQKTLISQSMICEGCIIEAKEITRSIIGLRAHIQKGTIIRDSILMGNHSYDPAFAIGKNCLIEKAIIDEKVQIGDHVKLINKKKYRAFEEGPVHVRDGIIVVTAGTKLPNNFEF